MRTDVAFSPVEAGPAHVAIVVDVMRATSTIAQALASGYRRVLCCREIEEAKALREQLGDEAVVGGERNAVLIEGFDLGASPRDYLEPRAETAILTEHERRSPRRQTRSTSCSAACSTWTLLRLRRVSQARTSRSSAPAIRARSRSTTPIAPAESSPSWKASRPTQRSPPLRSHGHIRPRGMV